MGVIQTEITGERPRHRGCPLRSIATSETALIAVIVPAHNEEERIAACLQSLLLACACPVLKGEQVLIVVVLDSCTDRTGDLARELGATTQTCRARNVGHARALGAQFALDLGARWLAFTDADTVVAANWLSVQLTLGSDAVCGTIAVEDWEGYGDRMRRHFQATYTDADDHRHVHGANLGVSAEAYRLAGGFPPLASSEDIALVEALRDSGAWICWSAAPRVVTSARGTFRAVGGFGATLARIEADRSWENAAVGE
jgi:glycosyltransferase involved in cell wall biosynthesis